MSTLQMNVTGKRIARLAQNGEILFHTKDLANIWDIANPNTLRVTLKRYVQNKLIYRMYKGFYSLIPPHTLPPLLLGAKALHRFCYVSTESILTKEGYINHIPSHHTFIRTVDQKTVTVPVHPGHDLGRGITLTILKDADISPDEFLKLL